MNTAAAPIDISVIVPVYNAVLHLRELLESLAAQTLRSLEIVVVDDGSTDGSAELIRDFAGTDARVRVITRVNGGVSAARNTGLQAARGRWLAFADADDWVAPDAYRNWLLQADGLAVDLLVGTLFRFCDRQSATIPASSQPVSMRVMPGRQWIREAVDQRDWKHYVFLQLVRAEVVRAGGLRFLEGIIHEDVLWTTDLALVVQRVGFCDAPFYGYRQTAGSLSGVGCAAACARRADGYFVVIEGLLARAAQLGADLPTRAALMRQAGLEAKHLYKLIRQKPRPVRRIEMARRFVAGRYPALIRRHGYGNWVRRGWRGLKAGIITRIIGAQRGVPPLAWLLATTVFTTLMEAEPLVR